MARFSDLSIRDKLVRTTLLATGVALLLASAAFEAYDVLTYREGITRRLAVVADVVGSNSVAPLMFEDRPAGARMLDALRAEPHVQSAALYDQRGRLFASYLAGSAPPRLSIPGVRYGPGRVVVGHSVVFQGSRLGTLMIESDLAELAPRLRRYALIVLLVSLVSLAVSLAVASRLQRAISRPILSLAATARAVSSGENYAVRAKGGGRDETGLLIATFNDMLDRIQRRDAELVEARATLEGGVAERTAELTRELAERRRTESELRRIQELLAEAQAMAKVASWEWNPRTGELWWSDEYYRLWGVDRAIFRPTRESVEALLHPEDRAPTFDALRHTAATGEPSSWEHRVIRPDGTQRLFRSEAEAVRDPEGNVVRVRGLVQDITEQRQAERERSRRVREQALREEAETARRRSAFVAQVASILASSLEWERTVSAAARLAVPEFADWALVDALEPGGGLRRVALAHRERTDEELEPLRRVVLRGDGACPSARAIRAGRTVATGPEDTCEDEGHEALLAALGRGHLVAVPFFTSGRPRGALVWCRKEPPYDASDILLAEEVALRTATALEHADLYREAQQANQLKDEFLATLSHELRTPLHAIVGWAHMLRTGSLDPEKTRRAIASIERNAQAQHQLISDVLDVSRIVAGKLRLNVRAVDLRTVVEAALDTVRPAADARHVRLRAELPGGAATVSGDAGRLQQVVWNLLANAIKFVPEGGSVAVTLEAEGEEAALSVVDDGPGIRPDFLPFVFERFRQADSSSTRPHGGLGLGLAIVRHLVELHGGRVEASNREDGTGAIFTVRLPLQRAEESPVPERRVPGAREAEPAPGALLGLDVLVVDDEPDSREIVATVLGLQGARVRLASNAADGLAELRRHPPDVLLSDLEMAGTDGFELLRRVRALPPDQGGNVLAAALTAYAGPEHQARALAAGFEMHVAKPIQPSDLVAAVAKLARRRRTPARAAVSRILVVDDEPDVTESMQLLLASPARQVETALDGPSALALAARFRPDLVLLDLGLPGIDGCEVARRMRGIPGLEHVKLLALSGYGGRRDREQTTEAGFDRHLVKPVDPGELVSLVDALAPAPAAS